MAEWPPGGDWTLTAWALATVDVTLFVSLAVLVAHASGALGDLLAGLNTVLGIAIFAYLWVLVGLAVRWVLAGASLGEAQMRVLALRGVAAGAATGVAFLLGVVGVAVVPRVFTTTLEPLSAALITLFGVVLAAPIGALLGLAFGLLDVGLSRLAGAVAPGRGESATGPDRR
ncbi:hypothetical protein ACFQGE_01120 [Halomicroarcula sp. GCM10025817]|uniref:hypothetical protein n=1 Tax=Haloarcula TaxID=2237 RepID=UPI0023E83B3D|nr:hypothetical protein [Halomicroarcula sp. SYNS111]